MPTCAAWWPPPAAAPPPEEIPVFKHRERRMVAQHPSADGAPATTEAAADGGAPAPTPREPVVREQPKVGRNEPCPCGSGKKFKKCHGA